jgi:serine/threonine-protein kinase RsbW
MDAVFCAHGIEAELPRLVELSEKFASRCGLPEPERARLSIIIEELFTNLVRYGYPDGGSGGRVEIALAIKPGRLQIEFSDDGAPFDPLAARSPELDLPATERPVGGLGLYILRSLVDEARYRRANGRNHLTLVRNLNRSG